MIACRAARESGVHPATCFESGKLPRRNRRSGGPERREKFATQRPRGGPHAGRGDSSAENAGIGLCAGDHGDPRIVPPELISGFAPRQSSGSRGPPFAFPVTVRQRLCEQGSPAPQREREVAGVSLTWAMPNIDRSACREQPTESLQPLPRQSPSSASFERMSRGAIPRWRP